MRAKRSRAEFFVHVHTMQNATWQGEAKCLASGKQELFCSFLELMLLLERWMDEDTGPLRSSSALRSWEEEDGSLKPQVASLRKRLRQATMFFNNSEAQETFTDL